MASDWATMQRDLITQVRSGEGAVTRGPFAGRQVLLLTTIGAKSGVARMTPLVYSRDGDRLVIVASKGGAPTHPAWYHNLLAHPTVTIEAGGEKWQARATVIEDPAERRRLYDQHARLHGGFSEYEAKAGARVIPVILLERLPAPLATAG